MPIDTFETFTQEKLIEAVRQNDEKVLKWIYQKNYPKVQQMVMSNSGTIDQAKDIYQEAFLAFWTNIKTKKFQPENESAISGYIYQISKNKWLDMLRSQAFKKTVYPETFPENIEEEVEDKEASLVRIEAAFAKMGENCRELLTRFYYQKDNLNKLAAHFGWTEATTKNNKYRCMEKLRASLKSHTDYEPNT